MSYASSQGVLAALNAAVAIQPIPPYPSGLPAAQVQLWQGAAGGALLGAVLTLQGSFAAAVVVEWLSPLTQLWTTLTMNPATGGALYQTSFGVASAGAPGEWLTAVPSGALGVRARASSYTSGQPLAALSLVLAYLSQSGSYYEAEGQYSMAG
jgi:hypothetical protein